MHHVEYQGLFLSLSCMGFDLLFSVDGRLVLGPAHEHSDYRGSRQAQQPTWENLLGQRRRVVEVMIVCLYWHCEAWELVPPSVAFSLRSVVNAKSCCGRDGIILAGNDCLYNSWIARISPRSWRGFRCIIIRAFCKNSPRTWRPLLITSGSYFWVEAWCAVFSSC